MPVESDLDLDALERLRDTYARDDLTNGKRSVPVPLSQFDALLQRLREAEAEKQDWIAGNVTLLKRIAQLERVLVLAAIPLEALNMDNSNGAKWMAPSVKQHVAEAVIAIRAAVEEK